METNNELDPNKFHILNQTQKVLIFIFFSIIVVFCIPVFGYIYYSFAINRPAQIDRNLDFEIQRGAGVSEIASNLYAQGLVNSENLFKLYVLLNGYQSSIQAGSYSIQAGTSVVGLVEIFQNGTNDVTLTFLEGWRAEEFAIYASSTLSKIDYEKFLGLAKSKEGFLFPDTYFVSAEITEEQLIELLTSTYDQKTTELITAESLERLGLTEEEIITLASIVEREVSNSEDSYLVAGILLNRFKELELVGADATTQYVKATYYLCGDVSEAVCPSEEIALELEWWPAQLTVNDLEIDSQYNTRKNIGLPPRPISNPGLLAIEAVVNYKDSEFRYYLHDSEGTTHFARTLNEHNDNVQRYLR